MNEPFRDIEHAISTFESRLASGTARWTPVRDRPEFQDIIKSELFGKTPVAWQRLVGLLPFEIYDSECSACILLEEPRWNDWLRTGHLVDSPTAPSESDLIIAGDGGGDWYAIRVSDPLMPSDAKVTHWDHETTHISTEWPTIAAFASHIFDMCENGVLPEEDA